MMTQEVDFIPIVDILHDIFGDSRYHNDYRGQITFDCPVCSHEIKGLDDGDGKGNLEVNYKMYVYKCWVCAETHDTHGHLTKLVRKYGSPNQIKQFNLFTPEDLVGVGKRDYKKLRLPNEYVEFGNASIGRQLTHHYKQAMNYLKSRNIDEETIDRYRIGYCDSGQYENRIIVPSFDEEGELNYFVARSFLRYSKRKYMNPQADKDNLIWNEHLIDWTQPVYIVEGAFDSLFLPNSIPLLGKFITDKLLMKIYDNALKVTIVLDGDAWNDSEKLYHRLNVGRLMGKVWVVKLPIDKDIADLRGDLSEYNEIRLD
jgi:DNA primase